MSHLIGVSTRRFDKGSTRRPKLFVRLITALAASAVVLTMAPSDVAAQADEDSDELIAVQAQIDAIPCPTIAGLVAQPRTSGIGARIVDGVRFPNSAFGFRCLYEVPGQPGAGVTEISVNIRYVGSGDLFGCDAEPLREQSDQAVTHRDIEIEESINATAQYTIPFAVGSALPGIEDLVLGSISQLEAVGPLAVVCQYEPVSVTCPEISGMTTEGVEVNTGDMLIASCNYLPIETEELQSGQASLSVSWATDRSGDGSLRRACSDPGEQFRDQTARIADGTVAAQVSWYSNFAGATSPEMNPAAALMLTQVTEQAASCEGVEVEAIFTPVPEYLADLYGDDLADSQAFYSRSQALSAPVVVETTVPTSQPAESSTTTTIAAVPIDDPPPTQGDQLVVPPADAGPPGWQTAVFAVVSIVAIVLSVLGVALALFLMRRETRIRPRFDVFRLLITVVVAVTMVFVFSRQAPLWAIAVAILAGGVIGVVQGRNLDIRAAGSKLYGRRAAWGLMAFAAGIVLAQVAGWLNRTGAISVGIALSFVSAALTAGLIVGRKPQIAQARLGSSAVVALMVLAGLMIAIAPGSPAFTQGSDSGEATEEPASDIPCGGFDRTQERCAAHETLIDLVDWEEVTFNGGLLAGFGKPPVLIKVARGLDAPPEPISRTIEWNEIVRDENAAQAVTETFSFELTSEGVCCSIIYDGTAQQRFSADDEPIEWAAEGRLSDIQTVGTGASGSFLKLGEAVRGVPFGEQRQLEWGSGGEDVCGRYVAETLSTSSQNAEFSTLTRDGESLADDDVTVDRVGLASMSIPCEVKGYTFDAAIEAAPAVPVGSDRLSPCPTRQELIPALADGGFEVTANATIGEMFTAPNEVMCSGGSFVSPIMFGEGQQGGTRSEFMFEFAPFDEQTVWGDDSALVEVLGAVTIDPDDRCLLSDDGRPIANPDLERCNYTTAHLVADGGWISISSDLQYDDGPNVTIRASMPWGTYRYRCHYCELDDPEIDRFIGALNDFAGEWPESLAAEIEEVTEIEDEAPPATEGPDSAEPSVDELTEQAEALGVDSDLIDTVLDEQDSDDPDRRAAAIAALVGLMGSLGLAGTALAESGMSATEVAEAFRSGGIDGINDALDERGRADAEATVIDEYGDELRPGEDGLYEWDDGDSTRRVDRAELEELIGSEQSAVRARDARHQSVVDSQNEAAAAERFAELGGRIIAENDALMAEIREGWDNVDELQSVLDTRERLLAELEAAMALSQRDNEAIGWDITWDALSGAANEVAGLPGEIVDAMRVVTRATVNAENAQVVVETGLETIYDVLGMAAGNTFGDGGESIANGTVAVGSAVLEDPALLTMFIPGRDLFDITDGERTLGGRLVSLGLGLVDVGGVAVGLGVLQGADDLVATARAVDRVGDAVEAGGDTSRAVRAADATDAAADANRGAAVTRVPDEALDPVLVQTRNQVEEAIAAAEREAARRTRLTGRKPPFTAREVYADVPEVRALYQGAGSEGMQRLGALEAAGGLDARLSESLLDMYDEVTGVANRVGATNAIDDLARLEGVQPREVLVGDSGSTGLGRSVNTDSDRTVLAIFENNQLDDWAARNLGDERAVARLVDDGVPPGDARRTVLERQRASVTQQLQSEGMAAEEASSIALQRQRAEANQRLQQRYRELHRRDVELGLNDPADPAVQAARAQDISLDEAIAQRRELGLDDSEFAGQRVMANNVGTETYADLGSPGKGGPEDSYARGVTSSRQSVQGTTRVIKPRVDANGSIVEMPEYRTSGDALVDTSNLEQRRFGGELSSTPTRMSAAEFEQVMGQQRQVFSNYDDAKSFAKAVRRMTNFGGKGTNRLTFEQMFGVKTPEKVKLVMAAEKIRESPLQTARVLEGLKMTDKEFANALKSMVNSAEEGV